MSGADTPGLAADDARMRLRTVLALALAVLTLTGCGEKGTRPDGGAQACNAPDTLTPDEMIWCADQIGKTW